MWIVILFFQLFFIAMIINVVGFVLVALLGIFDEYKKAICKDNDS